VRGIINFE